MQTCPYCGGKDLKEIRRSITNPADDLLFCQVCDKKFYRYQDTNLERPGDRRINHEEGEK